ncbi:MAG: HEAT repeat domain-containing protein [Acidobacteriota bacterium]
MDCGTSRERIVLLFYGELSDAERDRVESHIASCPDCGLVWAEERRLLSLLCQQPRREPSEDLLGRCREDLAARLETLSRVADVGPGLLARARRLLARSRRPWPSARVSPVAAVALLLVGFLCGLVSMARVSGRGASPVTAAPPVEDAGSIAASLSSLTLHPGSDRVGLTYDTVRRMSLEGSIDDPEIRGLILAALRHSLNAGLRLDAIDALSRRAGDPDVREALLRALHDANPGVRLKALDALQGRAAIDAGVRAAVARALQQDRNPGVRVRAMDALAGARDRETLRLLERLAREAESDYVRLRSAQVVDAAYAQED